MKTRRYMTAMIVLGGLLAGTVTGLWLSRNGNLFSGADTEPIRNLAAASRGAEPAHAKGPENAPVTIEEFGNFQCPPCANFHFEIQKLEMEYGPKIRFVFRHFPLEMHKQAMEAAQAAEAAALQGKFWEMHDLLYERQTEWSENPRARQVFTNLAESLKLDVPKFLRDMDAAETTARIQSDKSRGESIDIPGTPSVFINGSEVPPGSMTPEGIRALIDQALR